MQTVTLKPAVDALVRKQDGTPLAAAGEPIEINSYWTRRINDGDVVAVPEAKPKKD